MKEKAPKLVAGKSEEQLIQEARFWQFENWQQDYFIPFIENLPDYFLQLSFMYDSECIVVELRINTVSELYEIHVANPPRYYKNVTAEKVQGVIKETCDKKKLIIGILGHFDDREFGHSSVFVYNNHPQTGGTFYYYNPHGYKGSKRDARDIKGYIADDVFGAEHFVDVGRWFEGMQSDRVERELLKFTGQDGYCTAISALFVETALSLGPRYLSLRNIAKKIATESPTVVAVKVLRFVRHVMDWAGMSRLDIPLLRKEGDMTETIRDTDTFYYKNTFPRREILEGDTVEDAMRQYFKAEQYDQNFYVSPGKYFQLIRITKRKADSIISDYYGGRADRIYYIDKDFGRIISTKDEDTGRPKYFQVRVLTRQKFLGLTESPPSTPPPPPIPPPPPRPKPIARMDDNSEDETIAYDMEDEEQSFGSDNASVTTWPYDMGYESDITDDMEEDIEEEEEDDDNLPSSFYPTPEGTPERVPSPSI